MGEAGLGRKDDTGKLRWDLIPAEPLREIVKVLTFGAVKYAPDNWKHVQDARQRYYRALIGHIQDWREGEKNDKDSGCYHLAHAGCCLLFLLWFDLTEGVKGDQ